MFRKMHSIKAQAAFEYVVVLTAILFAFLVFQKYIARGLMGRWKATGDSFGSMRQYDPNRSTSCTYEFDMLNGWYDRDCYFANDCDVDCVSVYKDTASCLACLGGCSC